MSAAVTKHQNLCSDEEASVFSKPRIESLAIRRRMEVIPAQLRGKVEMIFGFFDEIIDRALLVEC